MGKQFTVIELDKHRNLRYGYKALILMEEMLKTNLANINMGKLSMKDIAVILFCGLKHEDPLLTLDKLIEIIDEFGDIKELSSKISEAFEDGFGKDKKK